MVDGVRGPRRVRWLLVVGLILLSVSLVVLPLMLFGEEKPSASEKPSQPDEQASGQETHREKPSASGEQAHPSSFMYELRFSSFDQMVATADLVVTGTVAEVRPGEVIVVDESSEKMRDLDTVVSVGEVLAGTAPDGRVVVKTLEMAFSDRYGIGVAGAGTAGAAIPFGEQGDARALYPNEGELRAGSVRPSG